MERLKDRVYSGLCLEIIREGYKDMLSERFYYALRISNKNDKKKKVAIETKYISVEHGLVECYHTSPSFRGNGQFIQSNSFVDIEVFFDERIKQAHDGDRIELDINEGRIASLLLIREVGDWYVTQEQNRSNINKDLKKLIEHFEGIEEKFGLVLQNFSAKVEDEFTLQLFCEVLALNGEISEEGFNVEVAIYDLDNNIVCFKTIKRYDGDFQGFEVFSYGPIKLDIPVDEIGKIRFYPTR